MIRLKSLDVGAHDSRHHGRLLSIAPTAMENALGGFKTDVAGEHETASLNSRVRPHRRNPQKIDTVARKLIIS
jgi:hypothetical protein